MSKYEIMYIVSGQLSESDSNKVSELAEKNITNQSGKVLETDKWGKRKFAYKIKGTTEGYYFLTTFEIEGTQLKELVGNIKIMDNVIRYLVVKLPE